VATDKAVHVEPATTGKTDAEKDEDSLAKLLKHINELQAENSELEEAMKLVRDGNLAKLKASVAVC
jgi:exonuclease VII small subunit